MKSHNLIFSMLFAFVAVMPCYDALGREDYVGGCSCEDGYYSAGTSAANDGSFSERGCVEDEIIYKSCTCECLDADQRILVKSCSRCISGIPQVAYYTVRGPGSSTGCKVDFLNCDEPVCPLPTLNSEPADDPDGEDNYREQVLYSGEYCSIPGNVYYYYYRDEYSETERVKYTSCSQCRSGYVAVTESFDALPGLSACSGPDKIKVCVPPPDECSVESDCPDVGPQNMSGEYAGYTEYIDNMCSNGRCVERARKYNCATGYCMDSGSADASSISGLHCTSYADIDYQWGSWVSDENGYQRREGTKKCQGNAIPGETAYEYQCDVDYYGSAAADGASGCEPCGKLEGVPLSSPGAGNGKPRSSCCVSQGLHDDDPTGTYEILEGGCCLED